MARRLAVVGHGGKRLTTIAFGAGAGAAHAKDRPLPERIRTWAAKLRKFASDGNLKVENTPVGLIGVLGVIYSAVPPQPGHDLADSCQE